MYDSDGGGFFAIGLLMMFSTLMFLETFLEHSLYYLLGCAIFIAFMALWMNYGNAIEDKLENWYLSKVRAFLKLFGIDLHKKRVWQVFCVINRLIVLGLRFGLFILVVHFITFKLNNM